MKSKKSKKLPNYRIFRIEKDSKTGKEKQITMKYFTASSDEEAYKVLKDYVKIANKQYKYYYGYANGHVATGKDKQLHYFNTMEEVHEFYRNSIAMTSKIKDCITAPFRFVAGKLSDFKYWIKDVAFVIKHRHFRSESWSIDLHVLDDLRFNIPRMIYEVQNGAGIPSKYTVIAFKEMHKDDPQFDADKAISKDPNVLNDDKVFEFATKLWIKTLEEGLLNVRLYLYYDGFGIFSHNEKDLAEIDKTYKKTLPYKSGTYGEFDYTKLDAMKQKSWNKIWTWMRDNGQHLWT